MAGKWYATGGSLVLNSLVGDLVLVNIGIDFLRPDVILFRHFLAKRARTQRAMNALYKRDSDIYVAFRLQLVCKFFVCGLLYSTAFPILYIICFGACVSAGWIDRYNFLRVWAPPPPTSERLIGLVARVIVPIAILGHTLMTFAFFRAIDNERHTGWSNASTLSCVAIGLTTPAILYFLLRQHGTCGAGRRLQIIPAQRLRTFREWFLDLRDEGEGAGAVGRGSSWQPTETFRETSDLAYYVPPLPRALLADTPVDVEIGRAHV